MSEQVKKKIDKKWISFGTLMLGAGTIYKLGFLKDAFYVPMQEFMGLSHTCLLYTSPSPRDTR